jgi:hypothetical protein
LPPLLAKELAEILSGRALWTMLLLICPLIGFSFVEAVSLFSEASAAALQSPAAAATLSPLDGILVPTFGSFYVAVTLLFPLRNSFAPLDQKLLSTLGLPLVITVNLAPEDPRYIDLRRNVLGKLERAMPNVSIVLAGSRRDRAGKSDAYGEIEYVYGGRSDVSRSTSPREILPLLYALAGTQPPAPMPGTDYPGYPLVANADATLLWFFCGLPLLIALAWWRSRQPPAIKSLELEGGQP